MVNYRLFTNIFRGLISFNSDLCYISIGQFNKYYFIILGSIIVKLLNTFITGFFPSLTPNNPVFLFGFQPSLLSHPFIKYSFEYLGIGLGGLISQIIFYIRNKDMGTHFKEERNSSSLVINISPYNSLIRYYKNKKSYLKRIFLVFFCYYFSKVSISSLDSLGFHQTKIWTFEPILIYILSHKILKTKMFKHQKFSLSITLIFATLFYFINSFIPESDEICENEEDKCGFIQFNVYQKIIYLKTIQNPLNIVLFIIFLLLR